MEAVNRLNRLIPICQGEGDFTSAEMLTRILSEEEHHIEWLENQLQLIETLGMQNYLIRQISDTAPGIIEPAV